MLATFVMQHVYIHIFFKYFFEISYYYRYGNLLLQKKTSGYDQDSYLLLKKIVSEYDKKIPQSQTADKPMAPQGRDTQESRETRKTNSVKQSNQLSLPQQDDCKTRVDIK